jgi:5-methylcytosine-specific restriction endonuclease McrA
MTGTTGWLLALPGGMEELKTLADKDLLRRTADLAHHERKITVELLRHLREVERRQLFLEIGYPSLYDYAIKELRFSEGAAYRRIQAMRLIRDVPSASQRIEQGTLSLTTAAKVQTVLKKTPHEDKEKVLRAVEGKTSRETDRELAKFDPQGSREFTRWLSPNEVQLTFPLDRPSFQRLQELQSLRSHKDVQKTYKVLVSDLVQLGHEKWNPLQRDANSAASSHRVNADPAGKAMPSALRRAVWTRDQGQCSYKIPGTDRTCGSRDLLQIDHIHPLALGGKSELANLRLLCAAHNRARAEKTFTSPRGACAGTGSRPGCSPDP